MAGFGEPDEVGQQVAEFVAAGRLVQQQSTEADQAGEQVVFREGSRLVGE